MFSSYKRPLAVGGACVPHLVIVAVALLWAVPGISAPKTDIVLFTNGDRLTGEIKSLRRGQLNLNTEATGTIGIEWDKISGVVSKQNIQVETSSGTRYFGELTYLFVTNHGGFGTNVNEPCTRFRENAQVGASMTVRVTRSNMNGSYAGFPSVRVGLCRAKNRY
jgi:hypothetical protein